MGIEFTGQVKQPQKPQQGQKLAQHLSKPLPELLKKMMKKSDNQIADALFRAVAYNYYKTPCFIPIRHISGEISITKTRH